MTSNADASARFQPAGEPVARLLPTIGQRVPAVGERSSQHRYDAGNAPAPFDPNRSLKVTDIKPLTPKFVRRAMERTAPIVVGRNRSTEIASIRKAIDRAAALQPNPRGVRFRRGLVGGVKGEWLEPKRSAGPTVLLYLHGGGYVAGSPATHRLMVGSIVRRSKIRAFVPDYRLAPESAAPAQLEDALATYRRIVEVHGAEKVVLAGDSAGGGLAVLVCCAARDEGLDLPRRLALLSPWADLSGPSADQERERGRSDIVMSADQIRTVAHLVEGDAVGSMSPVSSALHHLDGLPPTLIQVGTAELIGFQGETLAAQMAEAGVDVTLERWLDMQHVFQTIFIVPERRTALDHLAEFLTA